jgi:hypothetical protein
MAARAQGFAGGGDEPRVGRIRRPDRERDRGVTRPSVQHGAAVHAEQVAVGQPVPARDAVQRGVVDRSADDRGEGDRGEPRLVAEERRGGSRLGEHAAGDLVQFGQGHARLRLGARGRQDPRDDLPGGPHRLDLSGCLDLHHGLHLPFAG